MNADRLLQHYERIAEAPDAIARLRRFILDLAVRGKLVPQDANDEPASELLKRLNQERRWREKSKTIKSLRLQYGPISLATNFHLPSGWEKTTVGETCELQTGATPDRSRPHFFGGDIRWLVSGDINQGEIFDCDGRITRAGLDNSNCKILPSNCVLIALNGQGRTRGTVALLRTEAACNQSLVAIIPLLNHYLTPEYLHLSFKARYSAIRELTGKDERRGLNMRLIECFEIAVPPLAEQHRIVAKVDELMGLCDRLEAARAGREAVRDRLAAASLARLNAPDPESFQDDARFALNALPALTTRPDQIKRLRQTILNLAVRGKLVPQDPNDEPIAKRYQKEIGGTDIPASWRVLNFGKFCDIEGGNQPPKSQFVEEPRKGYVRLLQIRDLGERPVPVYIPIASARSLCKEGEILIGRYGASVGKVFWAQDGAYNVAMAKFIWPDDALIARFAFLLLKSEYLQGPLAVATRSAQAGFNKGDLAPINFPLPPLAEQHRIVAKVDALMALCDRLEASLDLTAATRRRLLDALLAEALAPLDVAEMEAAE